MNITDVSVEQIDRTADAGPSLDAMDDTTRVLMGSGGFKDVLAGILLEIDPTPVCLLAAFTAGIEFGFNLRDIAATDEVLESVERASQ